MKHARIGTARYHPAMFCALQPEVELCRTLHGLLLAALIVAIAGCGPSPEQVCSKLAVLQARAGSAWSATDANNCHDTMREIRASSPEAYACSAKCLLEESSMPDVERCGAHCPRPLTVGTKRR